MSGGSGRFFPRYREGNVSCISCVIRILSQCHITSSIFVACILLQCHITSSIFIACFCSVLTAQNNASSSRNDFLLCFDRLGQRNIAFSCCLCLCCFFGLWNIRHIVDGSFFTCRCWQFCHGNLILKRSLWNVRLCYAA